MRYFTKYADSGLNRLHEIVDLQWGILGSHVHLIASACYPFPSVLEALAQPSFVLPAEGRPGARYLPGAQVMDLVENEGEELVLKMFGSPAGYSATLQPHSGTQANQMVFNSVLGGSDKVLCLQPRDGGHVSHTVLIGRRNQPIYYGLTDDRTINYDELRELAIANSPKLIIVGGSALPREIDLQLCGEISRECGAYLHADISHTATFIAGGLHQTAFPHCDFITFNTVKNLRGPNGGVLLFRTEVENLVHRSVFPMTQGGANETNMFGKFVAFLEWKRRDIRQYATEIVRQARCMASTLIADGITVTTGGTDCHIVLLELMGNKRSGADWERLFEEQGVLVNKNLIPNDTRPPSQTSGLRIGTANLAILNYDLEDTRALAGWMGKGLRGEHVNDELIPYLIKKYHNQHPWLCQ